MNERFVLRIEHKDGKKENMYNWRVVLRGKYFYLTLYIHMLFVTNTNSYGTIIGNH